MKKNINTTSKAREISTIKLIIPHIPENQYHRKEIHKMSEGINSSITFKQKYDTKNYKQIIV
jgi:hypothetical protein